ncbi:MAG: glucosaminidase domain-containing protein [Peptostreptococcaceae bacterium]
MKLSKKMVSLMCLSLVMMGFGKSSTSNIIDDSNLSSKVINKATDNVVKEASIEIEEKEYIDEEKERIDIENIEVRYTRSDMTVPSNITKEELENVFEKYKGASTMNHLASAFVDAEKAYGVNAFAMAGIVALESGFATSRRAVEDNNLTGYEVYADDSKGRLFSSQYESIMQTAKHLGKNYLTEGGQYYNGVSVDAVQVSYCPDEGKGKNWNGKVDSLALGFFKTYEEIYKN